MLRHLGQVAREEDHPGLDFIRLADDIFHINGSRGRHVCFASKPQGVSVRSLQESYENGVLPKLLVKSLIHRLLFAINWLHGNCSVIHIGTQYVLAVDVVAANRVADISPQNVLTEAGDDTVFRLMEERESQEPSPSRQTEEGFIYPSRAAISVLSGTPILTDFGQMRFAEPINSGWCMPDLYRAPEVLLQLPWDYPVDLWSVGIMVSMCVSPSMRQSWC